ncbi:MAG: DUF2442 domain-containing protein [Candidatus Sulfotelmatobacter sp.]
MSFSASAADERVVNVTFTDDTFSVSLQDGRVITVPVVWYPRLLGATPAQRGNWKVAGGGYGIHWPDLDEDLSTEGLLRGAPAPFANAHDGAGSRRSPIQKKQRRNSRRVALQNKAARAKRTRRT